MGIRESQRALMAEKRAAEQAVTISPVENPARRLAAEADGEVFLSTYFPDRFTDPMTDDRRAILAAIRYRAKNGGDKAIAAPRGEGKTTFAELECGIDAIVNGWLRFPLIVGPTGPHAAAILRNIKEEYEFNDLLAADYPEVCGPIRDLDGAPQRCGKQRVNGERTRMTWSGDWVRMPRVRLTWCPRCYHPEPLDRSGHLECRKCGETFQPWMSKASGSVIETRGLDSAIRGIRRGGLRPDLCLIDDGETRESAKSEKQVEDRIMIIENDLGGLGGGRKRVARLLLCTVINSMCVAAQYTDKRQRPSWDGDRLALVKRWPDAKAMWERYIELRREGQEQGDRQGRKAHAYYVANRAEMDAGVVVSNEWRFSEALAEDGSPLELSTIQHVHNEASDKGWDYVFNELQNDPQDTETSDSDNLSQFVVRGSHTDYLGRCCGVVRGVVPDDCEHLTAFVDVQHSRLFYVVCAWLQRGRCHVVDYGDFDPSDRHRQIGVERAISERLSRLNDQFRTEPYHFANGGARQLDMVIVDSGDESQTVVSSVLQYGPAWRASKGAGDYHHPAKWTGDKRPSRNGDQWYESLQRLDGRTWKLIVFDPDWWRGKVHAAFRLPPLDSGSPRDGSVTLPGDRPEQHTEFAQQICDRQWFREWVDAKRGYSEGWTEGKNDHYLDCMIGNFVARSMLASAVSVTARKYGVLSRKAIQ